MKTIQKKCQVVLLPTKDKTKLWKGNGVACIRKYIDIPLHSEIINQHLYILSDEKIKEGDWYMLSEGVYYKKGSQKESMYVGIGKNKKIIATTNPELNSKIRKGIPMIQPDGDVKRLPDTIIEGLPKPTDQFIQDWITKGCPEFVNVEYEHIIGDLQYSTGEIFVGGYEENIIKISSDNTITCSFIENDWHEFIKSVPLRAWHDLDYFEQWANYNFNPPQKRTKL